jgi:hypothetical protein
VPRLDYKITVIISVDPNDRSGMVQGIYEIEIPQPIALGLGATTEQ